MLGNGFNKIYPSQNKNLFHEIIKNDGLVISEYSPDETASSDKFLARNRIVSGISIAILIIEAKYRSGTSVTAKLAKEQNRKIFAIPHEIWDINGVGTNRMIRDGAILVTKVEEIINEFPHLTYKKINDLKESSHLNSFNNCNCFDSPTYINSLIKNSKIKTTNNNEFTGNNLRISKLKSIDNIEKREVYKIIGNTVLNVNKICKKSNKSVSDINQILLMLEIEGYIKKVEGGYICI